MYADTAESTPPDIATITKVTLIYESIYKIKRPFFFILQGLFQVHCKINFISFNFVYF